MSIYTFVGLIAIIVYTISGIVLLALKYLQFAEYEIRQADRRAKRTYDALLAEKSTKEKEAYEKCLEEFYD